MFGFAPCHHVLPSAQPADFDRSAPPSLPLTYFHSLEKATQTYMGMFAVDTAVGLAQRFLQASLCHSGRLLFNSAAHCVRLPTWQGLGAGHGVHGISSCAA